MKVLNLYAGIGGNRKLWENCEVTAVENNENIAKVYQDLYPDDKVIIGDAHQYLLDNYKDFDFIWSSPPCPTHSSFRHNICVKLRGTKAEYPDMQLYQQIVFLKHHFKGFWLIENVKPYYKYLIEPDVILQRHPFWTNIDIPQIEFKKDNLRKAQIKDLEEHHGFSLAKYKLKNRRQILRNCVYPPLGKHIMDQIKKGEDYDKK